MRRWYDGLRIGPDEARSALRILGLLAATGIPAGLLWLVLAPRREFEVVDGGFRPLEPQSEALIGADAWLLVVTGVLGVLATGVVWQFVRSRGVAIVVGLAAGVLASAVVAWQVGEWLGPGPSQAEQSQIGTVVTSALELRAIPVLVIGALLATLVYLVAVSFVPGDDLHPARWAVSSGSTGSPTGLVELVPHAGRPAPSAPGAVDAIGPPTGPPSDPRPTVPDGLRL